MSETKYILDGKVPKPVDLITWARWFETAERQVSRDEICGHLVSTVFLGVDHNFTADGPPILFETMVFPSTTSLAAEEWCERACTWDEAEAAHQRGCDFARKLHVN
jgi:hypothetical protein